MSRSSGAALLATSFVLLSQTPVFAQMRTSSPQGTPNPGASGIQTMSGFKQDASIEEERPRIAVLQPTGQATNLFNNTLYGRIETGLVRLNRFTVINRSQIEALLREQKLDGAVQSDPARVGRLLSAQRLVVVEMISDPTATETTSETVRESTTGSVSQSKQSGSGTETTRKVDKGREVERTNRTFNSVARASIRFLDVKTGALLDSFEEFADVTGPSKAQTEDQAMTQLAQAIINGVHDRSRLDTILTQRDGRSVRLKLGSRAGVTSDMRFTKEGTRDLIRVTRVLPAESSGVIEWGYHDLAEGDALVEARGLSVPGGIGIGHRRIAGGSPADALTNPSQMYTYLDLNTNMSGVGPSLGVEIGGLQFASRTDLAGLGLFAKAGYAIDFLPEFLWLTGNLGLGGFALGATVNGESISAGCGNLLAEASLGVRPLPFWVIEAGAGYMSSGDVAAGSWSKSTDNGQSSPRTGPAVSVGGLFLRLGTSMSF